MQPTVNNHTSVKLYHQLFWCVFSKYCRLWELRHPKDSSHWWDTPWDLSMNEYSKRDPDMLNHWGHISIPATATRGPVLVSAVISYSLAYDAIDVIDNDNLATAMSVNICISIALIGMVRKLSVVPIVLERRWSITPEKAQKTIQATMQRRNRTMLHPLLVRWWRTNDRNLCSLFLPGKSCILRHDVCRYSVQNGQQMCTSICHRL